MRQGSADADLAHMLAAGLHGQRIPAVAHHSMPGQAIPLHVLAEIQRAMAHASVVAKQAGGVPCNPNDIFMQGAHLPCKMPVTYSLPQQREYAL